MPLYLSDFQHSYSMSKSTLTTGLINPNFKYFGKKLIWRFLICLLQVGGFSFGVLVFLYLWWVCCDVVENIDQNKEESYKQGHSACNQFNHDADAIHHHHYDGDEGADCDDDDERGDLVQCQGVWGRRSMRRLQKGRKADSRWWCTTSRVAQESEGNHKYDDNDNQAFLKTSSPTKIKEEERIEAWIT